jgi:hypothetical protein
MNGKHLVTLLAVVLCGAGIATAQTEWVEDPSNPIVGPGEPGSWDAGGHWLDEVVFDGSMYHMWFTGIEANGDWWDIGHATSTDGVAWTMDPENPVLIHGEFGEWDDWGIGDVAVVYDGTLFHMWYGAAHHDWTARGGYATSPDGTVWTKSEHNPVMDIGPPGSWYAAGLGPSSAILDGDTYRLWCVGMDAGGTARIGYAESSDGIVWERLPEPVLDVGTDPGSFDRRAIGHPKVVFDDDPDLYHMWYAGVDRDYQYRIGYAWSTDGIEWTKHRYNPVLERPVYEVDGPNVLIEDSSYRMWFGDFDGSAYQINLATSDGGEVVPALDDWQFIPAAAVASGAEGAFYQTDVDVSNADDVSVDYEFMWLPRGEDNSEATASQTFSLASGKSVRYTNVLTEVFGLEPDSFGALLIRSTSADLLAMSRTYNLGDAGAEGTYGQAMPAMAAAEFIQQGATRRILFGSENAEMRTNVGCQNGTDSMTVVYLDLFKADGTSVGRKTLVLKALGNDQVNRIFDGHNPMNGYVDVTPAQADKPVYCYGSVLDNLTSDPTTIPPQ